ncbi:MAG: PQQ-binding-like beta-propeller repeat protein [Marinosulfonomonas sp.]|nr:PQQ-binding-like beta-propeller repeat protein [Marinosulfonomonas sp.]
MNLTRVIAGMAIVGLLVGCAEKELILEGERLDLRTPPANAATTQEVNRALPIKLPATVNHSEWTHRNGTPEHRITHPALSESLSRIWSAPIGAGEGRKFRITADPVVADGRIFTMDSQATVMAHTTSGKKIWTRGLTPSLDKSGEASGGGLAIEAGTVFATTGYGTLVALNAVTGAELWVQKLGAAAAGAPTVRGGIVYVTSRDSRAWAISAKDGRIKWQLPGSPTPSVMVGGAAPAVSDKFVVFPFGSGELISAFRKGGVRTWASLVSGKRRGIAYAGITDITGDPVIAGNVVYAGSQSGRVVALDLGSGERIWTARVGAYSPVWPVGGSVFLVSDDAQLVRLDAATGERIWGIQMPYYINENVRRRKAVVTHYGPVLAGGRLIVASNDGMIRSYNPVDGALVSTVEVPGGATTNPVVVGGVLYVVSTKGQLHAFR